MKKNWEIKKLGEVCEIVGGTTPSTTNKSYWNGSEKWITPAEIDINKKYIYDSVRHITKEAVKDCSLQLQPKGTVIFTSRAPIGKVAISEMEFYCNQGFKNFICSERILNEYLYFFLIGNVDYLNSIGKGTTFKEISKTVVSQVEIPLPPLEEQKRIVKILDEKFAQLETIKVNAQTNLQNAKDLFQSQLTKAFSNTTWEKKRLGDVFYVKSGGTPSRSKKEYWNGDIPWYSSGELGNRYTTNSERNINSLAIDNSNAKLFPKGSLLIGMYDTAAMKMSILDRDATFNQAIAGVKPCEEHNLQFIRLYLDSIKTEMFELRRGTRQKNLSLEKIKEIIVPLPPLPEQKRIVEELDTLSEKVRQLQEIYTKQIANCDELKQSLLQKAFAGEL